MSHPIPLDHSQAINNLIDGAMTKFHFVKPESREKFRRLVGEAMRDLLEIERKAQIEAQVEQRARDLQNWKQRVNDDAVAERHRVLTTLKAIPNH
jgi:hypothetical protein